MEMLIECSSWAIFLLCRGTNSIVFYLIMLVRNHPYSSGLQESVGWQTQSGIKSKRDYSLQAVCILCIAILQRTLPVQDEQYLETDKYAALGQRPLRSLQQETLLMNFFFVRSFHFTRVSCPRLAPSKEMHAGPGSAVGLLGQGCLRNTRWSQFLPLLHLPWEYRQLLLFSSWMTH